MEFIDTHSHLSDESYAPQEIETVLARSVEAGVVKMLQADIDSSGRDAMLSLCDSYPHLLSPMLGLYPGSVKQNWMQEMDALEKALASRRPVAIGEIGLDYHYGKEFAKQQKEAFCCQMEIASRLNLPVNIHLRDATEDFFDIMESLKGLGVRGNIHAYGGSVETFRRLQRYGQWMVGIGGVVTFKRSAIGIAVADIPLESILLETDAPYLSPEPFRGSRNDSSRIPVTASFIAMRKQLPLETVAQATTRNAKSLFGNF